jgi:hypothetical protein
VRPSDPFAVGTRLLFENERIRVWTLEVPPGGSWGPHEHRTSYVTVVAGGSHIASVMDDGSVEVDFEAEVDHVDWRERPAERRVHTLVNRGERPYKNFIVELLDR